jgi:hypothetical protein
MCDIRQPIFTKKVFMYTKEGKNRAGEKIALDIEGLRIIWFGCCGYDMVELPVESPEQAEKLFEALLWVGEIEAD